MIQNKITIEEIAQKLKPLFGKKIDELYFRYSVANSMEERNEILQIFSGLYQKHLSGLLEKGILLEPPKDGLVEGDYPLGSISYARKKLSLFGLREKDWPRHVCVTGMSGSGKTTFAFQILKNFIEKDKPFLVFDWKKSFRPLLATHSELMCFTVGNDSVSNLFKTNINRPPKGVDPKEWINTLCDLLAETFSVSYGVHKILLETLDEAFEGWGIYEGGKHYPNWYHIKKLLENKSAEARGRETGWYESAIRVATVLTFGSFGKIVNYDGKKSLSIEDLFDKKVIFELNSLSNIEKKFFAEFVLTYIFKLKKTGQNKIDEGFNYSILVDEAHNVFLKKETTFLSESVTDMVYREMREYGISLICLDQHISKLSDTVKGNSACHVAFQQQLPEDLRNISSLMQIPERSDIFSQLPVGSAIVKLSDRYLSPFMVDVPLTDVRKNVVDDNYILSRMQSLIMGHDAQKNDKEFIEEIAFKNNPEEIEIISNSKIENDNFYEYEFIEKNERPNKESVLQEENIVDNGLNPVQNILFNFAKEQLSTGKEISEIEKLLDAGTNEGYYKDIDVIKVINKILEYKLILNTGKVQANEDFEEFNLPDIRIYAESKNEKMFDDCEEVFVKEVDGIKIGEEVLKKEVEIVIPEIKEIEVVNHKVEKVIKKTDEPAKADVKKNGFDFPEGLSLDERRFLKFLYENPNHEKAMTEVYKTLGLSARKGNVVKNLLLSKNLVKIDEVKNESGWKKFIRLN